MHQLFRLTQLERLPVYHRVRARRALNVDRTIAQFVDFTQLFAVRLHSSFDTLLLLPIYWAALDPDHAEPLYNASHSSIQDVAPYLERPLTTAKAITAILSRAISGTTGGMPLEALLELWNRLWFWVAVIDELFHDVDFKFTQRPLANLLKHRYITLASAVSAILRAMPANTPPPPSPQLWVFVGRAWVDALDNNVTTALRAVCRLLAEVTPENLPDMALGAGGSWDALARLVIRHMRWIMTQRPPLAYATLEQLVSFKALLRDAAAYNPDFQKALFAAGFIPEFIGAAVYVNGGNDIAKSAPGLVSQLLDVTFFNIFHLLTHAQNVGILIDACRGPLIGMLLVHAVIPQEDVQAAVVHLLQQSLPRWTLYASILPGLNASLAAARSLVPQALAQADPQFIQLWNNLTGLVHERMEVYTAFKQRETPRTAACANRHCVKIGPRHEFTQCSGCSAVYYCSKPCQRTDYLEGGHRADCSRWSFHSEAERQKFRTVDRRFFRALIRDDYARHRELMYARVLQQIRRPAPEHQPYLHLPRMIGFLYPLGRLQWSVGHQDADPTQSKPYAPLLGRLVEHDAEGFIVAIPLVAGNHEESPTLIQVVPVRRRAGANDIHKRLDAIAESLRADEGDSAQPTEEECLQAVRKALTEVDVQEWEIC
ncbi:hypothetical protein MIND_00646700 [Mycena indigotica]|uniref:MYND-type domain-containing protein n=1 Tax=Mycena indigotica TaxID=2126181 RepID=A0A8H6SUG8_9AGAR|nr:uncharacterized protein MIND_00646700 [Mycena indigotica]KAF7304150.1 hypothetical protein MIND_00646700 [Mycena indigotica]